MQQFATVDTLAAASQDDVLSLWTGLGYYARGRNLHKAAGLVVQQHNGELPQTLEGLVSLPGIGRSTAGAILSLGSGLPAPILDGNVKRVLSRYRCVDGWYGQTAVERQLWELTTALTPVKNTGRFNQAMMDLGATVCTRSKPDCSHCPLQRNCLAWKTGSPTDWPHKKPKKAKPARQTVMLLAISDQSVFARSLGAYNENEVERWQLFKHSFTHFDLEITPIKIVLKELSGRRIMDEESCCWVDGDLPGGCAAPVKRLLEKLTHTLL